MVSSEDQEKRFGRNLRTARKRMGYTQQDLSKLAGIDRATISLIENGRESPRANTVVRLAEVLSVDPSELWRETEDERAARGVLRETGAAYAPLEEHKLHPGLQALLEDQRSRIMLNLTDDEEAMLRSIRTRQNSPVGKDFFIDVLISYRRHQQTNS